MKGMKAKRISFKIGSLWESPALHILLTKENNVVVARCLDFTVSSHGKDEKDALKALAVSINTDFRASFNRHIDIRFAA